MIRIKKLTSKMYIVHENQERLGVAASFENACVCAFHLSKEIKFLPKKIIALIKSSGWDALSQFTFKLTTGK